MFWFTIFGNGDGDGGLFLANTPKLLLEKLKEGFTLVAWPNRKSWEAELKVYFCSLNRLEFDNDAGYTLSKGFEWLIVSFLLFFWLT